MSKSSQPIEWQVGEEQFNQYRSASAQPSTDPSVAQQHRGIALWAITGLAVAMLLYMMISALLTPAESAVRQAPELPAPAPSAFPEQQQGSVRTGTQQLEYEAIQGILGSEHSLEIGPDLLERLGDQSLASYDPSFVRGLMENRSGRTNGSDFDAGIFGLQPLEFLLDVDVHDIETHHSENYDAVAIASILVENPNDEEWPYGSYGTKHFYVNDGGSWQRVAPLEELLGTAQWIETSSLRFEFREVERETFLAVADEVDRAYAELNKMLAPSFSGREFRPPEEPSSTSSSEQVDDDEKLTLVSVPRDVTGQITVGSRQRIASPLVVRIPTTFSESEWLTLVLLERIVHLQVRQGVASKAGSDHPRWDQTVAALNGWLQKELMERRSPWHEEAASRFDPSIYQKNPVRLSALLTTDPNAWLSRSEQMQQYMLTESMIEYAMLQFGEDKLGDLVHGLSLYRWWADLIPATFGVSTEEFEAGWNEYLRSLSDS